MRILYVFTLIFLGCTVADGFSFREMLDSSYKDCLSSYSFMWNVKKHCHTGLKFLEESFENDFDMPFRLRQGKKGSNQPQSDSPISTQTDVVEKIKCFTAELMFEMGKTKKYMMKQNCKKKDIIFEGEPVKNNTYFKFILKCRNSMCNVLFSLNSSY